jgi:hypothetical protein
MAYTYLIDPYNSVISLSWFENSNVNYFYKHGEIKTSTWQNTVRKQNINDNKFYEEESPLNIYNIIQSVHNYTQYDHMSNKK